MTAYTLAARETVREIRESLSRQEPMISTLRSDLITAIERAHSALYYPESDYESVEFWARLAADLAGLIQQKEKAL